MFRRLPAALALFALLFAAEPLLHHHPLQGGNQATSGATCAVCVSAAHVVPTAGPAVTAPQQVVAILVSGEESRVAAATPLPRASRAPPLSA